ncbi:ABC-type sugar transport system substrate-binding protein [Marmoricola sp. URHA0025 HA25]
MTTTTTTRLGHMRTFATLSAAAIALAGLAGCGGNDASAKSDGGAGSSGKKVVQFVNPLPSYPTWKQIGDCMEKEAKKRGLDYKESGASGQAIDANAMITQVQQATANKVDAIITFPTSDGFGQVLKQAQAAGITTGTIYGAGTPESGADYNIGPDFTLIGETMINAVASQPGNHVVGLVAAADTGLGKNWLDGIKAAAAKTNNVKIVGEVFTGDDASKALPQVTALLTAHPDITDIVTHMGTTTPGATAAIKAKGLKGRTFLQPLGVDNGGLEAIKNGTARVMLLQNVCTLGTQMMDGVADKLEGKTPPVVPVGLKAVTADQVQTFVDQGWS